MTARPATGPARDEVQAHGGASAVAPENTIAAFRAAAEQGARWVELDGGIKVRARTSNDPTELTSFRGAGLTGVITDNPKVFLG